MNLPSFGVASSLVLLLLALLFRIMPIVVGCWLAVVAGVWARRPFVILIYILDYKIE